MAPPTYGRHGAGELAVWLVCGRPSRPPSLFVSMALDPAITAAANQTSQSVAMSLTVVRPVPKKAERLTKPTNAYVEYPDLSVTTAAATMIDRKRTRPRKPLPVATCATQLCALVAKLSRASS